MSPKQIQAIAHAILAAIVVVVALFFAWLASALTSHTVSIPYLAAGSIPLVAGILAYLAHQLAPDVVPAPPATPPAPAPPPQMPPKG